MAYAGFKVPNASDAAFPPQARLFDQDMEIVADGLRGNGVITDTDCLVTAQVSPNMTVHVAAGTVVREGIQIAVTAGDLTITTADAANPRIDIISVNDVGTKLVTTGTPSATPMPATIPQVANINNIVLAFVYVPAGDTAVNSTQIIDKRARVTAPVSGSGVIATTVQSVASANSVGIITRFAPEDHRHAGIYRVSVLGNSVGNTSAGAGSLVLAGGNNVTLSGATAAGGMTLSIGGAGGAGVLQTTVQSVASANSVGTVTRYSPEDHRHEGIYAAGVSTGGNTSGNTTVQAGRLVLAGGNNITLSVGTAAAGLQTVTIVGAAGGAAGVNSISVIGNTSGTTSAGTGSLILAGGPNITLSGATAVGGMTVSVSGGAGGGGPSIQTTVQSVASANSVGTVTRYAPEDHRHEGVYAVGVSTGGNTSGNTTVQAGRLVLAGGNNITLSVGTAAGGLQTVTISGAAAGGGPSIATTGQSVASANSVGTVTRYAAEDHAHAGIYRVSVGGNTAGQTSAGAGSWMLAGGNNITLSAATAAGGMTVSVVGGAGGGGAFTGGMSDQGNTAGTTGVVNSQLVIVGGSNITISQSINAQSATLTIINTNPSDKMYQVPTDPNVGPTLNLSGSMSSIFLVSVLVPSEMTMNEIQAMNIWGAVVSSATSNTTYGFTITRGWGLYSYNGASLALASSNSHTVGTTYTSNILTNVLTGLRLHPLPLNATIMPGNWWIAFSFSSNATRSGAATSATTMANSYAAGVNSSFQAIAGSFLQAADTNMKVNLFQGVYTVASASLPSLIASSQVTQTTGQNLWFRLDGAIAG